MRVDVKKRNRQLETAIKQQIQRNMSVFRDRFAESSPSEKDYVRTFGVSKRSLYRQMENPLGISATALACHQNYARNNGLPDYIAEVFARKDA